MGKRRPKATAQEAARVKAEVLRHVAARKIQRALRRSGLLSFGFVIV